MKSLIFIAYGLALSVSSMAQRPTDTPSPANLKPVAPKPEFQPAGAPASVPAGAPENVSTNPIKPVAPERAPEESDKRGKVVSIAMSYVGLREKTGNNDGPEIEKWLHMVNVEKGDPWCAAFNYGMYAQAGYAALVPKSAWSPDWVRKPTWTRANGGVTPKPADSFGIWFASKGRVAHTGLIEKWGDVARCIEGNSDGGGSREGDGVYSRRRSKQQIYSVRSWFSE